jgi:hypothetical protein
MKLSCYLESLYLPTKLSMFSDSAIDGVASATLVRRRGFLGFDEDESSRKRSSDVGASPLAYATHVHVVLICRQ